MAGIEVRGSCATVVASHDMEKLLLFKNGKVDIDRRVPSCIDS